MFLQIQNQNNFLNLHLTTCLSDWDMNEEIKLTTTTDQFYQDEKRNGHYLVHWHYARSCGRVSPEDDAASQSRCEPEGLFVKTEVTSDELCTLWPPYQENPGICSELDSQVQPSLWLMVNPTLACPIKYPKHLSSTPVSMSPTLECPPGPPAVPSHSPFTYSHPPSPTEESFLASSSSEYLLTDEDDASSVDVPVCQKIRSSQKSRLPKDRVRKLGLAQSKRLQRVLQESNNLKSGTWPRPPVNYCILIAMALNSSRAGSLNVQQIYNFTREHFPFFQTAPDGWKNTIRHNLCFSNSFKKTPQQVSSEGKRKSCLWHLTLDGRRRLRDEIQTLTGESFRVLKRSMNNPDMIQALFNL